jgi:undecaprenyl phosphate-alpha-L-ara4FN deformylase
MRLALKVDVDTYRGTREGVPRLVELLRKRGAGATFLFSLGPDHTGRAVRRVFRPGFFSKVSRTSVVSHYGLKTLLYGTLLPGPDIGRRCAGEMRAVRDAGFEVGIHCWDHVRWQDFVARADRAWTERQLALAVARFREVFGAAPRVHGAAGWQMNAHALRLLDALDFAYASDARGTHPFVPVVDGQPQRCPQLPTTLPTLDELIGRDGCTESNVAERLLDFTARPPAWGHVYTLHAELEGMKLAPVFDRLLDGWRAQGYALVSLAEFAHGLDRARLPRHAFAEGEIPGRSGRVFVQGAPA